MDPHCGQIDEMKAPNSPERDDCVVNQLVVPVALLVMVSVARCVGQVTSER
jgi:hypothetical protein